MDKDLQTKNQPAPAVVGQVDSSVRPLAWLHTVRVLNGAPGELDDALSFAQDNFPLGDAGLFERISVLPLYGPAALYAAVAAERERCARIVERINGWTGTREIAAEIRGETQVLRA